MKKLLEQIEARIKSMDRRIAVIEESNIERLLEHIEHIGKARDRSSELRGLLDQLDVWKGERESAVAYRLAMVDVKNMIEKLA